MEDIYLKNIAETECIYRREYGRIVFVVCLVHTSEVASQVMVEILRHGSPWEYLYVCARRLLSGQT